MKRISKAWRRGLTVVALGSASLLGWAAVGGADAGAGPAISSTVLGRDAGARAQASFGYVLNITGTDADSQLTIYLGSGDRVFFTSPQGFSAPTDSNGQTIPECQQHDPTTASCAPGTIVAVVGSLGGGQDALFTAREITIRIGATVDGQLRLLNGGRGNDRLTGGAIGDGLGGGGGADVITSRRGLDVAIGGPGRDRIYAGYGGDYLIGGGGPDLLNGGGGRDHCAGGSGIDRQRRCELVRGIP